MRRAGLGGAAGGLRLAGAVFLFLLALLAGMRPLRAAPAPQPAEPESTPITLSTTPEATPPVTTPPATPRAVVTRNFGRESFSDVVQAALAQPMCAGLTPTKLVAITIAPVFFEAGRGTTVAPSPMTLSRWDTVRVNAGNINLYAFDSLTAYPKAFFHPGVGLWQFDFVGLANGLTAAQAIDTSFVAPRAVQRMRDGYCRAGLGDEPARLAAAWAPWAGCDDGYRNCAAVVNDLYDAPTDKLRGGALVLTATPDRAGGLQWRTCQLTGDPATFPCAHVDPGRAQGDRAWTATSTSATPLSAPFYVFERAGVEQRHWLRADTGYAVGLRANRPMAPCPRVQPGQNWVAACRATVTWARGENLCDLTVGRGACCPTVPRGSVCQVLSIGDGYTPLPGDFNGDDRSDVLWYKPGIGADAIWYGEEDSTFTRTETGVFGRFRPVVGDFDANGSDDVLWYAPGDAPDSIWWGGESGFAKSPRDVRGTYRPVAGDFDGDGADDVIFHAPGPELDLVLWGSRAKRFQPTLLRIDGGYYPAAGDLDGDGRDDIVWATSRGGVTPIWFGREDRRFDGSQQLVGGAYAAVIGEYTGDARDDILWHRAEGNDALWESTGARRFTSSSVLVLRGLVPVPGDFNGDGRGDVLWYGGSGQPDGLSRAG